MFQHISVDWLTDNIKGAQDKYIIIPNFPPWEVYTI